MRIVSPWGKSQMESLMPGEWPESTSHEVGLMTSCSSSLPHKTRPAQSGCLEEHLLFSHFPTLDLPSIGLQLMDGEFLPWEEWEHGEEEGTVFSEQCGPVGQAVCWAPSFMMIMMRTVTINPPGICLSARHWAYIVCFSFWFNWYVR